MVALAEPHHAEWVGVIDVVAVCRRSATNLAGLGFDAFPATASVITGADALLLFRAELWIA